MATRSGVEYTNITSVPIVRNLSKYYRGRVRLAFFSFNTTTITVNNGDVVQLFKLPAGAVVLGGRFNFGAMGASATASIGYSGSATRYANAVDVSALGASDFANTQTLNQYDVLTSEQLILLTAGGANFAAAKDCKGHILYAIE